MSRIDDLIAEHCPDGVEFKPLGELVRIRNGRDHKALPDGNHPVYGSGGIMRYADTYMYDGPSVLIPRKGSLGNVYYVDVPFWTVDTIFYTEIGNEVEPKFLYHYLLTLRLETLNQAGGVPSQTQSYLNGIRIPVPPMEVQREIVRILDTFTQLEVELEAELEARRIQYAHYRESLLSFRSSIPRVAVGDFGELVRGNGMPRADFSESGIGAIHYGQIYTAYGTYTDSTLSYVPEQKASKLAKVDSGDLIVTNTSENLEDVGKTVAWLGKQQIVTGGHATVLKHTQNPKFLSYWFQTADFHTQKRKFATGTKVIDVPAKGLAKIEVPLPPLAEQERIVEVLDNFNALTTDLSIGLPAELSARRKQYEYYRDKLLTFREKA